MCYGGQVPASLLGAQPCSTQPERDFSMAGLYLSAKASSLDSRKVEVRMFNRQNREYRPTATCPADKTDDHSEESAFCIPILKTAAVQAKVPGWEPDE